MVSLFALRGSQSLNYDNFSDKLSQKQGNQRGTTFVRHGQASGCAAVERNL